MTRFPPQFADRRWRLSSGMLYHIKDTTGAVVPFIPNSAQRDFLDRVWHKNIILKARQLGFSTLIELIMLDACLFEKNISAGIITQDAPSGEMLLHEKIRFAWNHLPSALRSHIRLTTDRSDEIAFSNGSRIKTGLSFRGGTLQYLHISELAKIDRTRSDLAREIVTGALGTVPSSGYVFIESTAEGEGGYFHTLCRQAEHKSMLGHKLSGEEYRFFFYPWWKESRYRLDQPPEQSDTESYFASLGDEGIQLDTAQQNWYAAKKDLLGDDMYREYPSTATEAFRSQREGTYYTRVLDRIGRGGQLRSHLYDPHLPVYTAWDLGGAGGGDETAIWFFQLYASEVRLIDYLECSGRSLIEYISMLAEKPYEYAEHFAPHDIKVHEYTSGKTRLDSARECGLHFRVAPRLPLSDGIEQVRILLERCWFDPDTTARGLESLRTYRRKFDTNVGTFLDIPLHDRASHGADAFRVLALCLRQEIVSRRATTSSIIVDPFHESPDTCWM